MLLTLLWRKFLYWTPSRNTPPFLPWAEKPVRRVSCTWRAIWSPALRGWGFEGASSWCAGVPPQGGAGRNGPRKGPSHEDHLPTLSRRWKSVENVFKRYFLCWENQELFDFHCFSNEKVRNCLIFQNICWILPRSNFLKFKATRFSFQIGVRIRNKMLHVNEAFFFTLLTPVMQGCRRAKILQKEEEEEEEE